MSDPTRPNFVTKTDVVPELWQFINGLRPDDLVAELIQNEIDAGSTHTIISFEPDRFTCTGNGAPVDDGGWKRLSFLRGAGDLAPRKGSMIGVKNHGLKACFSIGDDIFIRSAGRYAQQTLYKYGYDSAPVPGASEEPLDDPTAPTDRGTIIEVRYRKQAIRVSAGEEITLKECDPEIIGSLFGAAVVDIPPRFIGVLAPGANQKYTVELRHHEKGYATFNFESTRPTKAGSLISCVRKCSVEAETEAQVAAPISERVFTTTVAPPAAKIDFPSFYQEERRARIEVSWPESKTGRPLPEHGRLRYPIAYAGEGEYATTGLGVHYSAPFKSDTERHGLAAGSSDWNTALVKACDELLVDAVKRFLIPKVGGKALDLLVDAISPNLARTTQLVEASIKRSAIPFADRRKKRKGAGGPSYRFVVPLASANLSVVDSDLAAVAPTEYEHLSSSVHPEIVRLIASRDLDGYGDTHVIFDETDALLRLSHVNQNPRFPWVSVSACQECLRSPKAVRLHLDAIWKTVAYRRTQTKSKVDAPFHDKVILPSNERKTYYTANLRLGAHLPSGLPIDLSPPLVHPDIADHPLLGQRGWDLKTYTIDEFLDRFLSAERPPDVRLEMFRWVERSGNEIPVRAWTSIRELPIWPDQSSGAPGSLDELCKPASAIVEEILDQAIRVPAQRVLALVAPLKRRSLALPIRTVPTSGEITNWLNASIDGLPFDRPLLDNEVDRLRLFERNAQTLAQDARLFATLEALAPQIPAMNQAGRLGLASDFVSAGDFGALSLRPEFLIDRIGTDLDRVVPPMPAPTSQMVIESLREDPENQKALIPRLRCLGELNPDSKAGLGVADITCIPAHGRFRRPDALAFKSNRGNFWGKWRDEIPGLADSEQRLFKRAGVIAAEPNAASSQAFFSWLAEDGARLGQHLQQVVRQFAHDGGPSSWWDVQDQLPCLAVQIATGFALVSHKDAMRSPPSYFLNDFPELGESIESAGFPVGLVVSQIEGVRSPIFEIVRSAGGHSLRAKAGAPRQVRGSGASTVPPWAMPLLGAYRTRRAEEDLQKALVQLGIPTALVRSRWTASLAAIQRVIGADEVIATFKIGRHGFDAKVRHAFDESSGTLWLAQRANREMEDAFFDALAERVFVANAPAYCAAALERALHHQVHEVRKPVQSETAPEDEEPFDDDEGDLGETPVGHHDWRPDPSKNIPAPTPIKDLPKKNASTRNTGKRKHQRAAVPNEAEHIHNLKERQYAWHCQVALAGDKPSILAPKRSYAEFQENRKRLIDAHHPDLVEAGGARHAGNVLILSHLSHHRYGRHISRQSITEALRAGGVLRSVQYGSGKERVVVEGVVITLDLPAIGERVSLFFTDEHREYWLSKAVQQRQPHLGE